MWNNPRLKRFILFVVLSTSIIGLLLVANEILRKSESSVEPLIENVEKANSQTEPLKRLETIEEKSEEEAAKTIPVGYTEIIQNNFNTGILVKDLNRFNLSLVTSEYCEGLDNNVIKGFYDVAAKYPNQNRRLISFGIANKQLIGEEAFNELLIRIEVEGILERNNSILKKYCGGSDNVKIDRNVKFEKVLNESIAQTFIGGYQYIPGISEALSFTTNIVQWDNENIIELNYLLVDTDLLRFSDVLGMENCQLKDSTNLDISCSAEKLSADETSLNKLLEEVKRNIDGLFAKNY